MQQSDSIQSLKYDEWTNVKKKTCRWAQNRDMKEQHCIVLATAIVVVAIIIGATIRLTLETLEGVSIVQHSLNGISFRRIAFFFDPHFVFGLVVVFSYSACLTTFIGLCALCKPILTANFVYTIFNTNNIHQEVFFANFMCVP